MSERITGYYSVYRWRTADEPDLFAVIRRKSSEGDPAETVDEIFSEDVPRWQETTVLREHEQGKAELKIDWIGWDEAEAVVDYFRRQAV